MVLVVGEILFDEFPRYKRLGGAPFNVAFHLNKLGLPSCFISRIGVEKQTEVADTVGAGDAYTAILAIGYLREWEPEKILEQASTFAGGICQIKGAIPADEYFYENYNFIQRKK